MGKLSDSYKKKIYSDPNFFVDTYIAQRNSIRKRQEEEQQKQQEARDQINAEQQRLRSEAEAAQKRPAIAGYKEYAKEGAGILGGLYGFAKQRVKEKGLFGFAKDVGREAWNMVKPTITETGKTLASEGKLLSGYSTVKGTTGEDINQVRQYGTGMAKNLGELASGTAKLGLKIGEYATPLGWSGMQAPKGSPMDLAKKKFDSFVDKNGILNYHPSYANEAEKAGGIVAELSTWLIPITRVGSVYRVEKALSEIPKVAKLLGATPKVVKSAGKLFYEVGKDTVDVSMLNALRGKNWQEIKEEAPYAAGGGLVLRGSGKILEKLLKPKTTEELSKVVTKKVEEDGVKKTVQETKQSPIEWVRHREDLNIEKSGNLGRDLEGNQIAVRFEKDGGGYKMLVSPQATEKNIIHDGIGHYVQKKDPGIVKRSYNELVAVTGGKKTANEDFSDAVAKIILEPESRIKAPKLTKELEDMGIKLKKPESVTPDEVNEKLLKATSFESLPVRNDKKFNTLRPEEKELVRIKTQILDNSKGIKDIKERKNFILEEEKKKNYDLMKEIEESNFQKEIELHEGSGKTINENKDVIKALRNTPYFRKEGVPRDDWNYILENPNTGKSILSSREGIGKWFKKGYTSQQELDGSYIAEKGFEDVDTYLNTVVDAMYGEKLTWRDFDKEIHEKLLKNNKQYRLLEDEIQKIKSITKNLKQDYENAAKTAQIKEKVAPTAPEAEKNRAGTTGKTEKGIKIPPKEQTPLKTQPSANETPLHAEGKIIATKLPEAVKNIAKEKYQAELTKGTPKAEAKTKALAKIRSYDKITARTAKDSPAVEKLFADRNPDYYKKNFKKVKTEGINWKAINTGEDTEKLIKGIFAGKNQFKNVRASKTNQDIIEGARMIGIDANDTKALNRIRQNMATGEVAHKMKQMMVDSAKDLKEELATLSLKYSDDLTKVSAKESDMIKNKLLRTQAIAREFAGVRTESSHLLRSMGIAATEGENDVMKDLAVALGKADIEAGDDIGKFIEKTQKIIKPSRVDTAMSIWYNAILSGWKTSTRNILDTNLNLMTEVLSKFANPMTMHEGVISSANMLRATPGSIAKFFRVFFGKDEAVKKFTNGARLSPYFKNKTLNFLLTEISGRMLAAQDAVPKHLATEGEKAINAFYKMANKAGITDDKLIAKVDKAVLEQFAERITYQNKPMSRVTQGLNVMRKVPVMRVIVPFANVVSNVLSRKVDYVPIMNIMRTFTKKYANKEADVIMQKSGLTAREFEKLRPVVIKRLQRQQFGRFMLGNITTVGAVTLAMQGRISGGGPKDYNRRSQMQEAGWRPYSVKLGDTWIPYNYFGALSGILSFVGSMHDGVKYGNVDKGIYNKLAIGVTGFAGAMLNQSFLSGVADIMDVAGGNIQPDKYFRNLLTGLVPVPAFWTQTAQAMDGKSYNINDWKAALKWKLGMSEGIPPRLNALGEEMRQDLIYGITPSKERNNIQKQLEDKNVKINIPAKTTQVEGKVMTEEQLWYFTKYRGEIIKKNIRGILTKVDGAKIDKKQDVLDTEVTKYADEAREKIKKQFNIPTKKK